MNDAKERDIRYLKELEHDLAAIIDRTNDSPNDRPENMRAKRLLNQIQLKRLQIQINDLPEQVI